jgi:hypothetical protein
MYVCQANIPHALQQIIAAANTELLTLISFDASEKLLGQFF